LHVAFAKRMLKWLAEGVRRGLELGGGAETPKDVAALLNLILKNLLELYVDVALEAAADAASSAENSKREPDLSYLGNLRTAVHITHLVQSCANTLLIPLVASSLTTKREMEKNIRTAVVRIQDEINTIEQQTIDAVLNWTSRLLSNQSRTDFRPRAETEVISLEQAQTPACDSVCKFLGVFHDTASQSFDGANLDVLLTEVAVGFRAQLLQHFTKYQVNRIGGVMLARDMSRYVQLLRSWNLDDTFRASLEVLTELASIFVLLPDALKERLRGQVLGNLGKEYLRPYLLKRDDYMEVGMQSLLHSL